MDHKVEKGLKDQLDGFLKLFRVHPSLLLLLWLTTYSMQDDFYMARSTGSYALPLGGDLSASFMCAIICVNIHEENPSLLCNASNFIINGGTFIGHISDTNHPGMRVCRSIRVLYQPLTRYTRQKIFSLHRTIILQLLAVMSSGCSKHQ